MKFHKNTEYPQVSKGDENYSIDVITSNPDGFLNIGFYHFKDKEWQFHTDTLTDPYENGMLQPFVWWYPPTERIEQF